MCGRFCTLNFTIRIVENVSGKGNERSSRPQLIVMKQRAPPRVCNARMRDLFGLKLASSDQLYVPLPANQDNGPITRLS